MTIRTSVPPSEKGGGIRGSIRLAEVPENISEKFCGRC